MRFLMLPDAKRWPCQLEDRCTTPAVAVVITDKNYVPACLGHMVELAEACRRTTPPAALPPGHDVSITWPCPPSRPQNPPSLECRSGPP